MALMAEAKSIFLKFPLNNGLALLKIIGKRKSNGTVARNQAIAPTLKLDISLIKTPLPPPIKAARMTE